uniref:Putative secreted protein n=1 Tax=Rhipicephalus microplus TaxID=6941 RepID=A0A6G5A488_RHIMP
MPELSLLTLFLVGNSCGFEHFSREMGYCCVCINCKRAPTSCLHRGVTCIALIKGNVDDKTVTRHLSQSFQAECLLIHLLSSRCHLRSHSLI